MCEPENDIDDKCIMTITVEALAIEVPGLGVWRPAIKTDWLPKRFTPFGEAVDESQTIQAGKDFDDEYECLAFARDWAKEESLLINKVLDALETSFKDNWGKPPMIYKPGVLEKLSANLDEYPHPPVGFDIQAMRDFFMNSALPMPRCPPDIEGEDDEQ